MDYYSVNRKEEQRDRIKSGIITAIIWACLLLFVFLYKVTTVIPRQDEVVSAMLINFGDNRNGSGEEEPAEQEGSRAAVTELKTPEPAAQPENKSPETKAEIKKENSSDKILTGNDDKKVIKKTDKNENTSKAASSKTAAAPKSTAKNAKTSAEKANASTGSGDGKGNAAIGNLIKGRGTKAGGQGTGTGIGNAGDPLGGEGNGDSRIGVDRKLVSFIPGTMGRGGAQPVHSCSASGSITISYTVDKAGNVVSARRSGGSSDPCLVSASTSWVKKYVKAERANFSSTGTYRITF